jgi:hypothetical protein
VRKYDVRMHVHLRACLCAYICTSKCACMHILGVQMCVGVFRPPDCDHLISIVMHVIMSYDIIMRLGKHAL